VRSARADGGRTRARRRRPRWRAGIARACCALALCGALAPAVGAQERFGATARARAPEGEGRATDPSAAVSTVEVDERTAGSATVDALVLQVPGARARRTGAYGAPTALALRGTEPRHTQVLLGDVPLDGADEGGLDLSQVPATLLARVEVYRGGAPTWWSGGAIGGVLRLVPREGAGERAGLRAGVGSFGLATVQGEVTVAPREGDGARSSGAVGVTASEGDYPYLDDNGTRLDPSDDVERRRSNGAALDAFGLAHTSLPLAGGRLQAVALGLARQGGIPGPAARPTRFARRATARLFGAATWTRERRDADGARAARVQIALSAQHERAQITDVFRETGLVPRATDDRGTRAAARLAAESRLTPALGVVGVASYRLERFEPDDALARTAEAGARGPSTRHLVALAVEAPLRLVSRLGLEVRPSARAELVDASLASIRPDDADGGRSAVTQLVPTFRVGAHVAPVRALSVRAQVAYGARVPTTTELFGDRGWLVGRVDLRPERALSADLGARLAGRAGPVRGSLELQGFASRIADLVRWERTAQFQATPANVDRATILGVEAGGALRLGDVVAFTGTLTALRPRDDGRDRVLPLRPALQAHARVDLVAPVIGTRGRGVRARLGGHAEVTHVGAVWADAANLARIEARTVLGLGATASVDGAWPGRLRVSARVDDLLDVRGADVLGFPLPGRAFWVEAAVEAGR
jgi:iron complex outermembrane receptor protein